MDDNLLLVIYLNLNYIKLLNNLIELREVQVFFTILFLVVSTNYLYSKKKIKEVDVGGLIFIFQNK